MGEAGGDVSASSLAVSISSPAHCGGSIVEVGTEGGRAGGARRVAQCLNKGVCSSPQLTQRGGEEEQQRGVSIRLPPLGKVGLGHLGFDQM